MSSFSFFDLIIDFSLSFQVNTPKARLSFPSAYKEIRFCRSLKFLPPDY